MIGEKTIVLTSYSLSKEEKVKGDGLVLLSSATLNHIDTSRTVNISSGHMAWTKQTYAQSLALAIFNSN